MNFDSLSNARRLTLAAAAPGCGNWRDCGTGSTSRNRPRQLKDHPLGWWGDWPVRSPTVRRTGREATGPTGAHDALEIEQHPVPSGLSRRRQIAPRGTNAWTAGRVAHEHGQPVLEACSAEAIQSAPE
jgi:hypothetical protein